ncbi:MAG TPA: PqiC family protein [Steroidobacteraceae bacterium]|nr:PqiC family protein [Steroidobacteraceae bacterium]
MSPMRLALAIALAALGAGCASSPPTQFFTLEPIPASHPAPEVPHGPIQIVAVHIPPLLDRDQIVREGSPGALIVSDRHRWGAPLGEMMRGVLTQDLLLRLPAGAVVLPQQPAPPQTNTLTVDVLRFVADASGNVILEGAWSLVPPGSDTSTVNLGIHITEPAGGADYAQQAHAMSLAVAQLADEIAGLVSRR